MRARLGTTWARLVGLGALSAALVGAPAVVAPGAQAQPAPGPGVQCLVPGGAPAVRRAPDTPPVSAATLARVEREVSAVARARAASSPTARSATLPVFRVKVQIHVIHGTHKGESRLKRRGARTKVFQVLRNAYNGAQSDVSERMGIVFDLKRITVTRNDRWFHARMNSAADRQMKRRLHRGNASTLNIYVNKLRPPAQLRGLLLGYSRFPWKYAGHERLDGVTINVRSLPIRGSRTGFNLGDTVVHETGHWLGLLHTFQRGCDPYNDGVADTPAEKNEYGNMGCADLDNLCDPSDVLVDGMYDPAYNFMEYTRDACMRMFTAGQHERVVDMFATYRAGR